MCVWCRDCVLSLVSNDAVSEYFLYTPAVVKIYWLPKKASQERFQLLCVLPPCNGFYNNNNFSIIISMLIINNVYARL
jgi:hypothetical protein